MDEVADDVRQAHRDEYHEEAGSRTFTEAQVGQRIDNVVIRERALIARWVDAVLTDAGLFPETIVYVIREGIYPEAWA